VKECELVYRTEQCQGLEIFHGDLQSACCQNGDDGDFLAVSHVEFPDQEDGQDVEDPIRDDRDCRVGVERGDYDDRVHASAFAAGPAGPEVGRRVALEDEDEEEEDAVKFRDGEVDVEDDLVRSDDGKAQQHDADAGFDRHAGYDEERLAKPPELCCTGSVS
jgi:hypothetical protein